MYRLAIIGAGQLGSRHLQGLARLDLPCEVYVVDPSPVSLEIARQRFDELPANPAICGVGYCASVGELPKALDYAVVSTSSDVRLDVLIALLGHSTVRLLLLEKVLFQRVDDYARARSLLESNRVQAWVNCPRRVYPIFSRIKAFFPPQSLRHLHVRGGDWSLGCNCIHFFDLAGMLTGAIPEGLSTVDLDKELIPSKRRNFMEFTGTLRARFSGNVDVELTSLANSTERLLLTLRSEHHTCIVDETDGCAFFLDDKAGDSWRREEFKVPFVSELGTALAAELLTHGTCALPRFEQSIEYHLPIIRSLGAHSTAYHGTPPDFCPIT